MKVKLKSDFIDFYDHWFNYEGVIFERLSKNNIGRSQMFKMFEEKGIPTPIHGKASDLFLKLSWDDLIVVYFDEYEHQGNGKVLCTTSYANMYCPNYYASQYISKNKSISYRELWLGDYHFVLQYSSDDFWRSNVGNVEIIIKEKCPLINNERYFDFPIYAIDYVVDIDEKNNIKYLAVDLNTAPMVRGTGIENFVSSKSVADSIKKYVHGG